MSIKRNIKDKFREKKKKFPRSEVDNEGQSAQFVHSRNLEIEKKIGKNKKKKKKSGMDRAICWQQGS